MKNTPNYDLKLPEKTDKIDITVLTDNFEKIDEAIHEVFTNASNGKVKVAEAITGKGIATSPTDTFDTMATNINKLSKVTLNDKPFEGNINLALDMYAYKNILNGSGVSFSSCSVVVYNNEVHVLGGNSSTSDRTRHIKWTGGYGYRPFVDVSTLPIEFYNCSALVYKNEIHILGDGTTYKSHYKWNGSSWIKLANLSFTFYGNCRALIYKDTIYALDDSSGMYAWNESNDTWTFISSIPSSFSLDYGTGYAFEHDSKIYIFKSNAGAFWNGSSWTTFTNTGAYINDGGGISYKGEIYAVSYTDNFYKFNINTRQWTLINDIGVDLDYIEQFIYKDRIHFFHGTAGSVLEFAYMEELYKIV